MGCWRTGRSSQTEHHPCILPPAAGWKIRVIRRHHPLAGAVLEVVRSTKNHLVVRHPDSVTMLLPRAWTDAGGATLPPKSEPDTQLTVASLRDLVRLVDALRDRV